MTFSSFKFTIMNPKDYLDDWSATEETKFISRYSNINLKLKKRFLRNPNITEASDQFIVLAIECEKKLSWQYAGLCYLAAARCFHVLNNTGSQVNYSIRAAKCFLIAERLNRQYQCPSIGSENIEAACKSIFTASQQTDQREPGFDVVIAGSIYTLATSLGSAYTGIDLLKKSLDAFSTIRAIDRLISFYNKQGDYVTALEIVLELNGLLTEIHPKTDYYNEIARKTEINHIILSLILQPSSYRLPQSSAKILNKYVGYHDDLSLRNFRRSFPTQLNDNEILSFQSLILACQSMDIADIQHLECNLWDFLDAEQKDLLRTLVRITCDG